MNSDALLDVIVGHAMAAGLFERVNTHEPKSAPGKGLRVAIWADRIEPVRSSGLDVTSARVVFNERVFSDMLQEPQDAIDPNIIRAVDTLMAAYSGDFDLGGNARHVDLLGAYGVPMSAQAAYVNQDQRLYRVMTITLPIIVNDAWTQAA